ncbi:hydrogenase maturation nickel metallochaperone HypA [bacterium]|nr:hydrogenase maturation nickel metallochaperone HypA [bacterium]
MKKGSDEQLSFDLPEPQEPARPRSKRLRFRVRREATRTEAEHSDDQAPALLREPVLARCGFCGHRLTVQEQVAICPNCGGIVGRPGSDDEAG